MVEVLGAAAALQPACVQLASQLLRPTKHAAPPSAGLACRPVHAAATKTSIKAARCSWRQRRRRCEAGGCHATWCLAPRPRWLRQRCSPSGAAPGQRRRRTSVLPDALCNTSNSDECSASLPARPVWGSAAGRGQPQHHSCCPRCVGRV
eukprot:351281-Chlamydomonas_euryale.AAC.10